MSRSSRIGIPSEQELNAQFSLADNSNGYFEGYQMGVFIAILFGLLKGFIPGPL